MISPRSAIEALRPNELPSDVASWWDRLHREVPLYASPFFSRHFTNLVASVRDDVWVGVERDTSGVPQVVWPFQDRGNGACAPGGAYADYQGPLVNPGYYWDAKRLLSELRVPSYDFRYLLTDQQDLASSAVFTEPALQIQLPFTRKTSHEDRKHRQLLRDHGDIEFQAAVHDRDELSVVLGWKQKQCERTGFPDIMKPQWFCELLDRLVLTQEPGFQGTLSVLRAGGKPVAAMIGLRSWSVWHLWVSAYDPEFSQYSPGWLLLREILGQASREGLSYVDLGPGDESFKRRWSDRHVLVHRGAMTTTRSVFMHRQLSNLPYRFQGSMLYRTARSAVRSWRQRRSWQVD